MTQSQTLKPVFVYQPTDVMIAGMSYHATTWEEREDLRRAGGVYVAPVWENEAWFQGWHRPEGSRKHYTHVCLSNPALLAYTADEDKGARDIQTPIKPGRYLTKFFGAVLTERQIAHYARWQATGIRTSEYTSEATYALRFASTSEDIVSVYMRGPASCMDRRNFSADDCPVRVYAAGDLQVAYLEHIDTGKIVGRALVWPEKSVCGRVYPTDHSWAMDGFASDEDSRDAAAGLEARLAGLGYIFPRDGASFEGARILRVRTGQSYVMPYLDGDWGVSDIGSGSFVMTEDYEHDCNRTDGLLEEPEEEEDRETCDRCEDELYSGASVTVSGGTESWCEGCRERRAFYCEGSEEYYSIAGCASVEVDGSTYSRDYAENYLSTSDYSGDFFTGDEVALHNGDTWSEDEFIDHGFVCSVTGYKLPLSEEDAERPGVWSDAPNAEALPEELPA